MARQSGITCNEVKEEPGVGEEMTRVKRMGKYMSLADTDDFLLYCEVCGVEYPRDCPVHGPLLVVEDKEVPQDLRQTEDPMYCDRTLPEGLEIKPSKIANAGLGVFATERVPARTRFGPYKGVEETNEDLAHYSGYCWQIYIDGKPSHFVDARDPCHSNWMRFVNCGRCEDDQCLTAYQHEGEIYYRAHRDIPPGTELLVFYGYRYAEEMNIVIPFVENVHQWQDKTRLDDDRYTCTKCRLAFSTDVFLERHLSRLHGDSDSGWGDWTWEDGTKPPPPLSPIPPPPLPLLPPSPGGEGNGWLASSRRKNRFPGTICRVDTPNDNDDCSLGETTVKQEVSACGDVCGEHLCDHQSLVDQKADLQLQTHLRTPTCSVCRKTFDRDNKLQRHLKIHTGEKRYKCSECSKGFRENSSLVKHMRVHTGEKPYKCSECNKGFKENGSLVKHMRVHTGEKPYACSMCSKAFNQTGSLQKHMKIHTQEKTFKCSMCSRAFLHRDKLQRHLKVHSEPPPPRTLDKPYECSLCSKAFHSRQLIQAHMRIHTGEKPYQCSVCFKAFHDNFNMQRHMKIHSREKPYECSVCDKVFSTSCQVQIHLRTHTGEKPYKCSVCTKSFSDRSVLRRHMRIHTEEKQYKCSECSKSFCDISTLHTHMKIHTKEKPYKYYKCPVCNESFTNLKIHMRIHSGEKPYKCSVCDKAFSVNCTLQKHMKIHTAEKPYACSVCNKAFSRNDHMKRHMRSHFGEKS